MGVLLGIMLTPVTAAGLRAGVAKIDITPGKPVRLSGYASRTNLSQGVHDPLSARAVVFEHEDRRLALVSLDNIGFYGGVAEPLRQAILKDCSLKPSELFLCAIHTHSAPTLALDAGRGHSNNVAYTEMLRGRLVEVVRKALDQMAPVQVGYGSGSSPVGANRREKVRDSAGNTRIVLGRNPSAMTDREVQVLKLTRPGGNALAGVLFAYATHSTSLGPRNYIVSGDVHGLAEQFLEKHLGADVVAPAFAGCSGDIDPWYRVLPGFDTTNGWVPEPVLLGTMLGEEVAHVLRGMQKSASNGPVNSRIETIDLPGKPRGEAQADAAGRPVAFTISVGCVGDIAFVGLGGEVFNEIGRAIKAASPFPHTVVMTHCNNASGYVPTRASYAEGGYEVQSSPFAPGADERLTEAAVRLLGELRQNE